MSHQILYECRARLLETGVVLLESPLQCRDARRKPERLSFLKLAELNPEDPELAACAIERLSGRYESGCLQPNLRRVSGISAYRAWAKLIRGVAPDFPLRRARPSRVVDSLEDAFSEVAGVAGLPAGTVLTPLTAQEAVMRSQFPLIGGGAGEKPRYLAFVNGLNLVYALRRWAQRGWPYGTIATTKESLPAIIGQRKIVNAKTGDASAFVLLCDAEGDEFLYVNVGGYISPVEIGGNNSPFLLANGDVDETLGRLDRMFPDRKWSIPVATVVDASLMCERDRPNYL